MTKLAAAIGVSNLSAGLEGIEKARLGGADIVELRADYWAEPKIPDIIKVVEKARAAGLEVIVTARDPAQGGVNELDEDTRLTILCKAAKNGANFIDCELIN